MDLARYRRHVSAAAEVPGKQNQLRRARYSRVHVLDRIARGTCREEEGG
jgi:hypothetical protein